jgi:Mg2+ and Co2+ transporter CorA
MDSKNKSEVGQATFEPVKFRSIPNMFPSPSELNRILGDDAESDWETEGLKQNYAVAFHRNFRLHLKRHYQEHEQMTKMCASESALKNSKIRDHGTFVNLFAAPLFKIVAANWARLIVRRSFDLDLLEWRPKQRVTSRTIDEIKSRRIAITRHQRSINSSMEVVRALMLEEREQDLKREQKTKHADASKIAFAQVRMTTDSMADWNRGRSNGLVSEEAKDDSWESIFWDFVELKASIDALEKRANQIQDGLCGQIQVVGGEKSGNLNLIAMAFTVILLPFSIIGTIYGANLKHGGRDAPLKHQNVFVKAVCFTFIAVIAGGVLLKTLANWMWNWYTIKFKVNEWRQDFVQWTGKIFHYRKLKRNAGRWQTDA